MIRRIKARTAGVPASILDEFSEEAASAVAPEASEPSSEAGLNILLKHAFRVVPDEHDAGTVWQRLTRKMSGPSGTPALEGPTQSSLEIDLTSSGGWSHPVPFVLKDPLGGGPMAGMKAPESLWALLRFDSSGLPQRGCTWMLA